MLTTKKKLQAYVPDIYRERLGLIEDTLNHSLNCWFMNDLRDIIETQCLTSPEFIPIFIGRGLGSFILYGLGVIPFGSDEHLYVKAGTITGISKKKLDTIFKKYL